MDLIIFPGFHKNGSSCDAENEGEFDCDSDDGEVDHDAEMNELVSFENKVLDFIDPKGPRFTILKGVEAVAWLKKKYEGHENIRAKLIVKWMKQQKKKSNKTWKSSIWNYTMTRTKTSVQMLLIPELIQKKRGTGFLA